MITAAIGLHFGCTSKLPGQYKQNFLTQATLLDVLQERADRSIDWAPQHLHTVWHIQLRGPTVHVPARVVNGNEATTGFAQTSSQQQLPSQRRGTLCMDSGYIASRVVPFDKFGIFFAQIESRAGFTKHQVHCLLRILFQFRQSAFFCTATKPVQRTLQCQPIVQTPRRDP